VICDRSSILSGFSGFLRHDITEILPTLVMLGTDCTGSCKSNYHKITISLSKFASIKSEIITQSWQGVHDTTLCHKGVHDTTLCHKGVHDTTLCHKGEHDTTLCHKHNFRMRSV
jgi:hypothetical protein